MLRLSVVSVLVLAAMLAPVTAAAQPATSASTDCARAADDYRAAKHAFYANNIAESERLVSRALVEDPRSSDAHRLKGILFAQASEPDEAMKEYRKSLAIDPEDAWTLYDVALILDDQKKPHDAELTLDKAVGLKKEDAGIFNNRGWARYEQRHFDAARADFLVALAIDPERVSPKVNLAHINVDTGHYKEALSYLDATLAKQADNIEALDVRAQAYTGLKMAKEAEADRAKAEDLRKKSK